MQGTHKLEHAGIARSSAASEAFRSRSRRSSCAVLAGRPGGKAGPSEKVGAGPLRSQCACVIL